ncbi:MAG: hypothetical protein KGJ62_11610 [Armatimonadetes bacterium]|nr:hypothetical protein [Armatimonadota bacterium]MDE2206773.1 hypothetical protein [Armatimonadota bacterium]
MNTTTHIMQDLYELQLVDNRIAAITHAWANLNRGDAQKSALQDAEAALAVAEQELHAKRAAAKDLEIEARGVEQKRVDYERKLYSGTVTIPKELQAMQDEVAALARQRDLLLTRAVAAAEASDAQATECDARRAAVDVAAKGLAEVRAGLKHSADRLQAEAVEMKAARSTAASRLSPARLQQYNAVRASKSGVAVAPLLDGHNCGSCRMAVADSVIRDVLAGRGLPMCNNCGRFLCSPPPQRRA